VREIARHQRRRADVRARDAHRGAVDAGVTVPREDRIDSRSFVDRFVRSFVAMSASRALRRVVAGASSASRPARGASAVADAAPRVGGGERRDWTSSSIPASRWRRGARARGANDGTTSSRCAPSPSYLESKRRRAAVAAAIARSTRAAAAAAARRARAWDATARADARDGAYCDDGARRVEKFSRVGVLGAPNAGKSALACALVGDAVSAVSRKTNTTRTRALGVRTVGDAQVVFVDAPGIVGREHYRNAAHARKVEDATALASECDALVFVVDAARQLERRDLRVLEAVRKTRAALGEMRAPPEAVLVLNKVDKIPKERRAGLTKMVDDFRAAGDFEFARVFPVSALTGAGTRALMDHIVAGAREAPWEFDATSTSDMTPAQRALEIVRESVYDGVHEDLPYGIDIAHVSWEDFRNGDARIEQNILVDTASQRKIVVGKSGEVVGRIGINARAMLERALNRKVHLILNVRLKKKKKNYRSDDVVFAEQY
jgi:GTP-binding protein Era